MKNINKVYKKSGKAIEVNDNAMKYLSECGLSLHNPKKAKPKTKAQD
jgi:hypothetical protein